MWQQEGQKGVSALILCLQLRELGAGKAGRCRGVKGGRR